MTVATSDRRSMRLLVILLGLFAAAPLLHAQESDNPWNEPRLGPAEARQLAPEINTWADDAVENADESKFPPMDEDTTLGIEPAPVYSPAPIVDAPATAPATSPQTGLVTQAPVPSYSPGIGYAPVVPAPGYYAPPYSGYGRYGGGYYPYGRGYRGGYGFPWSRPGGWGGSGWPGGGGWPGSSWGDFPFGDTDWMPFGDSWFW